MLKSRANKLEAELMPVDGAEQIIFWPGLIVSREAFSPHSK